MEITLRFFANFRDEVGQKSISRTYDATTVGEVLTELEAEFPGLAGEIMDDDAVRGNVNVLLNGRDITHEDGIASAIEAEDTLSIFPPVAGG
ncbi:UNVERIFIED_CONTAM: molybdopterin synthase sulfur carrier subunit [Euhalothece sp. KZN 001]|jgi:molybdopterin synthase sulfur carrier subunit